MKLCVAAQGKELDSKVSEHFGKAPYFLIVDTDTMSFEAVLNEVSATGKGTGVVAAQIVLDHGASTVLAGRIGQGAFDALKVGLVEVYEGASKSDTVREAVVKFLEGQYHEASSPSGGSAGKTQ